MRADETTQRLRTRYAKTGKTRFVSAIDLGRIWERSLRRADLPIAYSEGFSPHPKVSFPDALPLGYASTGEYAELTFAIPVSVGSAMAGLNAAFPTGLAVLDAVPVVEGAPKLSKWLKASLWELDYPDAVSPDRLAESVAALRASDSAPVGRERKGEVTEVDLRPSIHSIAVHGRRVAVVLHHVEPPVRPTEVHLALQDVTTSGDLPEPSLVTRVAQGTPTPDGLSEALSGAVLDASDGSDRRLAGAASGGVGMT